jgi:hypothetical protein
VLTLTRPRNRMVVAAKERGNFLTPGCFENGKRDSGIYMARRINVGHDSQRIRVNNEGMVRMYTLRLMGKRADEQSCVSPNVRQVSQSTVLDYLDSHGDR